jgi:PleD family two-component response regulator
MPPARARTRPPQVLIASHHTGSGHELAPLAELHGYTVHRAFNGAQALDHARAVRPDVVLLDESLPDLEPRALSRALRDDVAVGTGAPILLVTTARPAPIEHMAALRAGVWEFLVRPFNAEEIAAKLHNYVLLKLEADRARRDGPVQDASGLYTTRGLALRAQELTLQAFHHDAALACIALAPAGEAGREDAGAQSAALLGRVLKAAGRRSDAIGRMGPGEFAIVAPGTNAAGAVQLAQRLAHAVRAAAPGARSLPLRVGYDAVGNTRYTPVEPKNLLSRATTALKAVRADGSANWIRAFQEP